MVVGRTKIKFEWIGREKVEAKGVNDEIKIKPIPEKYAGLCCTVIRHAFGAVPGVFGTGLC